MATLPGATLSRENGSILSCDQHPGACTICEEPRQYVKKTGRHWTTLEKVNLSNRNSIKFKEPGLIEIGMEPQFASGQRALFLRTPKPNVLWDCIPLLDGAVIDVIERPKPATSGRLKTSHL